MTDIDRADKDTAAAVASAMADQFVAALAASGVLEADGLNALAVTFLHIASHSHDERIRPQAVLMLRELADKLQAQDEILNHLAAGGTLS